MCVYIYIYIYMYVYIYIYIYIMSVQSHHHGGDVVGQLALPASRPSSKRHRCGCGDRRACPPFHISSTCFLARASSAARTSSKPTFAGRCRE